MPSPNVPYIYRNIYRMFHTFGYVPYIYRMYGTFAHFETNWHPFVICPRTQCARSRDCQVVGEWQKLLDNVTQHRPVHHPLETHYDDSVVDEPQLNFHLGNLSCKTPPTPPSHYLGTTLCIWVSR
jgi:hypothetical protein